jgi:L-seryl-tRNA(Ser) seleniumtransferase
MEGIESSVIESEASVGAGAFPAKPLPSFALRLSGNATELEARLRCAELPVIGRISDGGFLLDLRSVPKRDDASLGDAVVKALG